MLKEVSGLKSDDYSAAIEVLVEMLAFVTIPLLPYCT